MRPDTFTTLSGVTLPMLLLAKIRKDVTATAKQLTEWCFGLNHFLTGFIWKKWTHSCVFVLQGSVKQISTMWSPFLSRAKQLHFPAVLQLYTAFVGWRLGNCIFGHIILIFSFSFCLFVSFSDLFVCFWYPCGNICFI